MKVEDILDWDEDELEPETEEEVFAELIRAVRNNEGAGWFFVQCGQDKEREVIERLQNSFGVNRVALMDLEAQTRTFYAEAKARYDQEQFRVLVVRRIEEALFTYEDAKRSLGWDDDKISNYSLQDVPPLLNHLNQVRENLWTNVPCAIVFLLPYFAVQYFRFRAPDFYDWRVGLFILPQDKSDRAMIDWVLESKYKEYCQLSSAERLERIAELKNIITSSDMEAEQKANLLVKQGLLFDSEESYENAISCYRKATEFDPSYVRAWNTWGATLCDDLGRVEEAISKFDRAIEKDQSFSSAWHNRGVALGKLGRYEESLLSYDKSIELEPDDYSAWRNRSKALRELGQYEEAVKSCEKSIVMRPDDASTWNNMGVILCDDLGRYEEAIKSFDKAIEIEPNLSASWHSRGVALQKLRQDQKAIDSYKKAIETQPGYTNPWNNLGTILCDNLERYEEAIYCFDELIKIDKKNSTAWYNRGVALRKSGRYGESLSSCEKAIELQSNYPSAWHNHGIALRKLERYEEAISSCKKVIELNPEYLDAWNTMGAILCDDLGKYEEAIHCFDRAIQIDKNNSNSWYSRGVALGKLRRHEEAVSNYEKAIEIKADYILAYNNLALSLIKLKSRKEAIACYETILQLKPYNIGIRGVLFRQLLRTGQWGKAFKQCLSNFKYSQSLSKLDRSTPEWQEVYNYAKATNNKILLWSLEQNSSDR
ncbi:MAG: tetratricopeptide repeat protein [Roseofilum sp. SID2]|uniref:tetratricopeptide repeat protein n=1 Tax=unclassified Roseofilum TaxID=2620099 RepID=UPI001B1E2042|nr:MULTISPECIES: tetratricopeptide repeat protein [unclassified Roseofilum]MBP0012012.1 tetratricopeptide repeat protein [Roseofilum sp. SID3]MBP0026131.1 tetratricopeptide repeat protein [Roseofilum sp. SID2]